MPRCGVSRLLHGRREHRSHLARPHARAEQVPEAGTGAGGGWRPGGGEGRRGRWRWAWRYVAGRHGDVPASCSGRRRKDPWRMRAWLGLWCADGVRVASANGRADRSATRSQLSTGAKLVVRRGPLLGLTLNAQSAGVVPFRRSTPVLFMRLQSFTLRARTLVKSPPAPLVRRD